MSGIWHEVGGEHHIQPIAGQGYRLVESQESVATTEIVSNLEKQAILEDMIDTESKPGYCTGTEDLHYLLSTPFRYPPLQHGSRFGNKFELSLFYGGTSINVTLCESAYYRFFFYHDMETPPANKLLKTQHTLFEFGYESESGVKLHDSLFSAYHQILRDPVDYQAVQMLGSEMRESGVKVFEYYSARNHYEEINVALFDASPFTRKRPLNEVACLCQTSADEVVYSIKREITLFSLEQFLVKNEFPIPAS